MIPGIGFTGRTLNTGNKLLEGLMAYYEFDGEYNLGLDSVGNYNGVAAGRVIAGPGFLEDFGFMGNINGGVQKDRIATNCILVAPSSPDLATYSAWVYRFGDGDIFAFGSDAYSAGQFHLLLSLKKDALRFGRSYYGGGSESASEASISISEGWHHVVLVKTRAYYYNVQLYNNGKGLPFSKFTI